MADVKISALPDATSVADADLIPIVQGGVTKVATKAELLAAHATTASVGAAVDVEAALARDATNLLTGFIPDARIPAAIARDTEVAALVNAEAVLARNASSLTSGIVADILIAPTIARDTEVTTAVNVEATLARNANNLTSGTVADGLIPASIARGTEVTTAANAAQAAAIAASQPLDADLTAIAEIVDVQGDIIVRGTNGWERLPLGTATHVLTAGASIPGWAAPSGGSGNVATDTIFDAAGDLPVGTGLDTAARLPKGNPGQVLRVNSGATALEWASPAGGGDMLAANNLSDVANLVTARTNLGITAAAATVLDDITTAAMLVTLGGETPAAAQTKADAKVVDNIGTTATTVAPSQKAVVEALAVKAPLASPLLTGVPQAPTAAPGTNTIQIATTAYAVANFATTAQGALASNAIPLTQRGALNGVATLDAAGVIPTGQLPPLAINEVFTAANQAAMLALTAQRGDVARRTDSTPNKVFLLAVDSPTLIGSWVEITATGSVTSVDGAQGAVSLATVYQPIAGVLTATTASFLTADRTKLDTIESSATADQTPAELLTAIKTVDGIGSGLNADLLDDLSSAAFTQVLDDYKVISLNCTDPLGGALVAQTGVAYARIPDALNGWVVTTIAGHLITPGTGITTVAVSKDSGATYATTVSLLGTDLSLGNAVYNVTGTLNAAATTVAVNNRIRVDIGASPNAAARGLIVQLTLRRA